MTPVTKSSGLEAENTHHASWADGRCIADEFLKFNDGSKSPYHAAESIAALLRKNGFRAIKESDDWASTLEENSRYFFTRDGSSIVAFVVPNLSTRENLGFTIIGAHTDSPCFKVKPKSKVSAHGYLQLGVECYGGGLWHTWFDRDLTVAGRVVIRREDGKHVVRLVSIPRPILRIPNLAIHLSRNVHTEGFKVNKETDTTPIIATQLAAALNTANGATNAKGKPNGIGSAGERHSPLLLEALAKELNVDARDIVDLDLCISDTQPAAVGGMMDEFVFAPRLDNLASCFTATRTLIAAADRMDEANPMFRMIACFDHEEVGSRSSHGADSPLLIESMQRMCAAFGLEYERTLPQSLLISADMAHAIHPNYSSKHETNHKPQMGGGLVIKTNQNQRYATSGISGFIVREAARRAGNVPIQEFVVPNDKPCGSTIGPILSSRSGLRTVDVGQAQLSMHSIREMCSVRDFALGEKVLEEVMLHYGSILREIEGGELTE